MSELSTTLNNVPELRRVNKMIKCVGSPHSDVTGGELVTLSTWEINNVQVEVLHVDDDRTMFNATRLYTGLCPASVTRRGGFQQTWFNTVVGDYPDDVRLITLRHPDDDQAKTNVFMDWFWVRDVVKTVDPRAVGWWLGGNPFDPKKLSEGYVYLVQSKKHRGTTIFKVGQTMNVKGRMDQYGKDRLELRVVWVANRFEAEKQLKDAFSKQFEQTPDGKEWFECRSIELAIEAWDRVWLQGLVVDHGHGGDDHHSDHGLFTCENVARDSRDAPSTSTSSE